ncbi:uncharacterized protein LOC115463412 [Microcaecilia unicolor]|uniref:Uncharacterized protein LOC115463412 n=1 Tax=Microcaecilia unicolor TaxID=1415580 RepID=A0A6P7XB56_9AMPH|nr:uncharacterized protein LOC115463412 [Microcaecilia unicolor]
MVISKGMGALEIYLDAEEGVAFRTDIDMYWTSWCENYRYVILARDFKDHSSKFKLTRLPSGRILLRDFRDMYLSYALRDGVGRIEPVKVKPDRSCEFEPYFEEDKVALRATNGMFVCRAYRSFHFIEASQSTPEECCRFRLSIGDLLYPCHDILNVTLGKTNHIKCQPSVVKKETFANNTDEPLDYTFNLAWEMRASETTTWPRLWGLESNTSTSITLQGMEATITYNGSYLTTMSTFKNISEKRSSTVSVPPHSKAVAQLVVTKQDQVEVPFVANIKKTKQDGEAVYMEVKGSWKGLVYTDVTLETKEEPETDYQCTVL